MSGATTAILYAPGTNCHEETAAAVELAGGHAELVLLSDLLQGRTRLDRYQAAVIPGGFSYGDHLGAGRIFATVLVAQLRDELTDFLAAQKPMLGVCNGFQVLAESGILPGRTPGKRSMALLENQSARFEDRKVRLVVSPEKCVWTEGLAGEFLEMPAAHGEGRPLFCSADHGEPASCARVVFRYVDSEQLTEIPTPPPTETHHPVPHIEIVNALLETLAFRHINVVRDEYAVSQDGMKLFRNLVKWLRTA